jgi:hypothetical protein
MIGGVALRNITTFSINLKDDHSKTTALKTKHILNQMHKIDHIPIIASAIP